MTGNSETSWSWLNRAAVPACLVVAEAAWVSMLVNAAINSSPGVHVNLPFGSLVLPALLGIVVGGASARLRPPWGMGWRRVVLLSVIGLVGVALCAGLISQLTGGAPTWWQVSVTPWAATGHRAAVIAAAAWFVAVLGWGRGVWLGVSPPIFRHALWSLGLGAVTFVAVFAGRANLHEVAFRSVTGNAGWLLFVWFPFIAASLALVHQRDLELRLLRRPASRPTSVWFVILGVPMLIVALVALLLAVIVGPAAPVIEHAVVRSAVATAAGVMVVVRWLTDVLSAKHNTPARPEAPTPGVAPAPTSPTQRAWLGHIPPIVSQILVVAGLVLVLALIAYIAFNRLPRWRRSRAQAERAELDQRDSLFSWSHLAAQLGGSIRALSRLVSRRLVSRLRRSSRRPQATAAYVGTVDRGSGPETVRDAYRRMLVAARRMGHGRIPSETTRQLQARLSHNLVPGADGALEQLTDLYDRARYGESELDEAARLRAADHADTVADGLTVRAGS